MSLAYRAKDVTWGKRKAEQENETKKEYMDSLGLPVWGS
jgi:hypothetical protein